MSKLRDAFVRAVNDDGTIQIGHANPDEEYGERPIEIITVSLDTAYGLTGELLQGIRTAEAKKREQKES